MAFHPYLNFRGNCREAFTRYQEIFGGALEIMTMAEAPGDQEVPGEQADLVMHAALEVGDHWLFGSDDPSGNVTAGSGMYINYSTGVLDDARRVYEALADGGEVEMPLGETFWSPLYGICKDRFGVPWMVNTETAD